MNRCKLSLIQYAWQGSRENTKQQVAELIRQAAALGSNLVCLPEFSLSPYFASCKDDSGFDWAESAVDGDSVQFFSDQARIHKIVLIGSLFEKCVTGEYRNTAIIHDAAGACIGATHKVHIPGGTGYHEDHFYGGGDSYPVHRVAGLSIAVPTCYDQWFPETSRISTLNGAQIIIYPTAIGSELDRPEFDSKPAWQLSIRGQAVCNGVYMAAINRTGSEGVEFFGSSFICDPMGNVLAEAGRSGAEVITADLNMDLIEEWRKLFPFLSKRRPETYQKLVETNQD